MSLQQGPSGNNSFFKFISYQIILLVQLWRSPQTYLSNELNITHHELVKQLPVP